MEKQFAVKGGSPIVCHLLTVQDSARSHLNSRRTPHDVLGHPRKGPRLEAPVD